MGAILVFEENSEVCACSPDRVNTFHGKHYFIATEHGIFKVEMIQDDTKPGPSANARPYNIVAVVHTCMK